MHDASIVVARPAAANLLVLLFHGVGSSAANLVPLGEAIAQARPDAMVASVDAPQASTLGSGREWFSVLGVTEQNRPARIERAMPSFLQAIAHWQQAAGIAPEQTVLVGFSQGAILALESTQVQGPLAAGRVIALAGRFAQPVRRAPAGVQFHLIHGEADNVVPARFSVEAAAALQAHGAQVTLDLLPGLGHGIDARAVGLVQRSIASR
ncbi:esterase [Ramlibacter ginsenosidimutans]|uniref:Esterase n=1 Tax=Ramlibacter ginsenosidimutans TaxID=502333 RepID=A0A934TPR7_9BURK|nr:esterase [Ramlibacter ginsenosidimutans]MBK6004711.1 esterase [Ramlibacter ginsenosidimutans]